MLQKINTQQKKSRKEMKNTERENQNVVENQLRLTFHMKSSLGFVLLLNYTRQNVKPN